MTRRPSRGPPRHVVRHELAVEVVRIDPEPLPHGSDAELAGVGQADQHLHSVHRPAGVVTDPDLHPTAAGDAAEDRAGSHRRTDRHGDPLGSEAGVVLPPAVVTQERNPALAVEIGHGAGLHGVHRCAGRRRQERDTTVAGPADELCARHRLEPTADTDPELFADGAVHALDPLRHGTPPPTDADRATAVTRAGGLASGPAGTGWAPGPLSRSDRRSYACSMAVLSAAEIYHFARLAGFSPDQAVTMTAVALAESGGNTGAHNPHGENSQGLWQINVAAHTDMAGTNLYDPLTNARAAFQVSHQGQDVSPWTTTHGGDAAYLSHRVEAETAARMAGDNAHGVWTGTPGYGHALAAGGGDGGGLAMTAADMTASAGTAAGGGATEAFVNAALAQAGDAYVFGAEADVHDPNPTTFDCSELVQWAAGRVGIDLQDGSWNQYMELSSQGPPITVEQAIHTRGALLFDFSSAPTTGGGRPSQAHVAISLGDGRTIEAMDDQHGVLTATANTKRFNYAAVIPGLATASAPGPSLAAPAGLVGAPVAYPAVDTDLDGILDAIEVQLGTNPLKADSDGDGISDGYEKFTLHTDPTRADTDGDGISDSAELAKGTDPTSADSNHDGRVDGGDITPDTDHDGLSDMLEKILGTRPDSIDTDGDGVSDFLEHRSGLDPLDPMSNGMTPSTAGSLAAAADSGLDHPSSSHGLLPDPLTGV